MHGAFVQSQQKTRNANDAITGNELYIMWCAAQVKTAETHFDFVCMFNVYKYEKKRNAPFGFNNTMNGKIFAYGLYFAFFIHSISLYLQTVRNRKKNFSFF